MKTPLKEYGEKYLLDRMNDAQLQYEWFTTRLAISITDQRKNKTELRGQLRIRRDSAIWVSLTPMLNIEAARILITPDSVKFINRLDRTYFNDDFSLLNTLFSSTIDYYLLQSLLTGNDLVNYETENFKSSIDGHQYKLSSSGRAKKKRYLRRNDKQQILLNNIWLEPKGFKINKINIMEVGDEVHKLQATYTDYAEIGGQLVPTGLDLQIDAGRRIQLEIRYQRPELDLPQPMPFRIPDNFSKMK